MKCVICRQAETKPGTITVTLERDGATFVFKNVPALVCLNCGEEYVAEETTDRLLSEARKTAAAGTQVEIRCFAPA